MALVGATMLRRSCSLLCLVAVAYGLAPVVVSPQVRPPPRSPAFLPQAPALRTGGRVAEPLADAATLSANRLRGQTPMMSTESLDVQNTERDLNDILRSTSPTFAATNVGSEVLRLRETEALMARPSAATLSDQLEIGKPPAASLGKSALIDASRQRVEAEQWPTPRGWKLNGSPLSYVLKLSCGVILVAIFIASRWGRSISPKRVVETQLITLDLEGCTPDARNFHSHPTAAVAAFASEHAVSHRGPSTAMPHRATGSDFDGGWGASASAAPSASPRDHSSVARLAAKTPKTKLIPGKTPATKIRNFSIIAHIDHGKSTLADRMLELTGTVDKTDMKAQLLDSMDIERERGITIKLNSARMEIDEEGTGETYCLNLIDTPGHVDFTYEVSRSLQACEGALLVVDSTQGVEAQTLANVMLAMEADLEIIPVLNKVDLPASDPEKVKEEIEQTIGIDCSNALMCSAKTGVGVPEILQAIIEHVPAPKALGEEPLKMLIYDSCYDSFRGVVVMFRIVSGVLKKGQKIAFCATKKIYSADEIGYLIAGERKPVDQLSAGEVGYFIGAIKTIKDAQVGDTVVDAEMLGEVEPLPGYTKVQPMVFAGFFPGESESGHTNLQDAIEKLVLQDGSISYEMEQSAALGMGYRCGFMGLLHMEVIRERLEREFDLDLIVTAPSVTYQVELKDGTSMSVEYANQMPPINTIKEIREPYVSLEMVLPEEFQGACMKLAQDRRGLYSQTKYMGNGRILLEYEIPMAEIIRDFFNEVKSRTRGYASMDYRPIDFRPDDLIKLDILVNETPAPTLSTIVHKSSAVSIGRKMAQVLKSEIPAQQVNVIIQAKNGSAVLARETIKAVRKDVTAKCYGGDISRKKKLLMKQKEGKKRMQAMSVGNVSVPNTAVLAVFKAT